MTTIQGWGPLPELVQDVAGRRGLLDILARHDVPRSSLTSPEKRIPLVKMVRVFEAAARLLGDENFGARVGEGTTPEHYGEWSFYSYSAKTLGQGLKRVCRAIWAHETGSKMYLSQREHHVVWCYETGLANHEAVRQFSDRLFDPMIAFIKSYLGADWQPPWIEVDYVRPQKACNIHKSFDAPIYYGCSAAGIAIANRDLASVHVPGLELPRPFTTVDLLKYKADKDTGPTATIRDAVDLCLQDGHTDIEHSARFLDVGIRTLQRRLKLDGLTFRDVLQQARCRRAVALLLETEYPLKSIAMDLGYRNPENFTRAFRRWNDMSPSDFRRLGQKSY